MAPMACLNGLSRTVTDWVELVDAPGPNEARANESLHELVNEMLSTADVIIFVFDYMNMGSTDEQQVCAESMVLSDRAWCSCGRT